MRASGCAPQSTPARVRRQAARATARTDASPGAFTIAGSMCGAALTCCGACPLAHARQLGLRYATLVRSARARAPAHASTQTVHTRSGAAWQRRAATR